MSGALVATFAGVQTGGGGGGGQTQCAPVTFNPNGGEPGVTCTLSSTTTGGHIFYTMNAGSSLTPTHNGDNPTGSTVRIGSNSGGVSVGGHTSQSTYLSALCFKLGLLDSSVSIAIFDPIGAGGGGGHQ